jgi:hypothetical protein
MLRLFMYITMIDANQNVWFFSSYDLFLPQARYARRLLFLTTIRQQLMLWLICIQLSLNELTVSETMKTSWPCSLLLHTTTQHLATASWKGTNNMVPITTHYALWHRITTHVGRIEFQWCISDSRSDTTSHVAMYQCRDLCK